MEAFSISRLDTEVGLVRIQGFWDPLSAEIQILELALFDDDGWVDVVFWLTEQEYETYVLAVQDATKRHLA